MIKTVSLETAKLLKEAEFKQDTFATYLEFCDGSAKLIYDKADKIVTHYSALTTDELLEKIPDSIYNSPEERVWFSINKTLKAYSCSYQPILLNPRGVLSGEYFKGKNFESESLPEALAQMWLWLKKENLI